MRRFGMEEEFMFVDVSTLRPLDISADVQSRLRGRRPVNAYVHAEFLASQIERSSPVFDTLAQAEGDLLSFRTRLSTAAAEQNALAVGAGTPFHAHSRPAITDTVRYHRLESEFRGLVVEHLINGLHVHVAIPDRDAGVEILNRVRAWLPTLLAMSANSPFWDARDTGFASWRTVHGRRWSTSGCPPSFADAEDYDRRIRRLVGVGGTYDLHTIWWNSRLAENHPTVEVRVCDAQLDALDTLLLTALIRALVSTALNDVQLNVTPTLLDPELLDAALWHAARDGLQALLLNPVTATMEPAASVVNALITTVSDALDESGDTVRVRDLLSRLWRVGTGAERQRSAFRDGGVPQLAAMFRGSIVAHV